MEGVFAIEKPPGYTSSQLVMELQRIFTESTAFAGELQKAKDLVRSNLSRDKKWKPHQIDNKVNKTRIKIGHGGTLDPLATGVIIIGVGAGTKKLQTFLNHGEKTYEAKALLGFSTTTGDVEGEIVSQNPVDHITKEDVARVCDKFVGSVTQTPPIFSAIKVNGKPLYEYARKGLPLPTNIKKRVVSIKSLTLHEEDLLSRDHPFGKLSKTVDENGDTIDHMLKDNPTLNDSEVYFSEEYLARDDIPPEEKKAPKFVSFEGEHPDKLPLFHITTTVSSGTYIRSLLSDIGRALGSSAYMVELTRLQQNEWVLHKNTFKLTDFTENDESVWSRVLQEVFAKGAEVDVRGEFPPTDTVPQPPKRSARDNEGDDHNEKKQRRN